MLLYLPVFNVAVEKTSVFLSFDPLCISFFLSYSRSFLEFWNFTMLRYIVAGLFSFTVVGTQWTFSIYIMPFSLVNFLYFFPTIFPFLLELILLALVDRSHNFLSSSFYCPVAVLFSGRFLWPKYLNYFYCSCYIFNF